MDTEGGLSIKMKYFYILSLCIFLLTGCQPKEVINIQPARIFISETHGIDPCILEVFPDGTLEVTTGAKSLVSSVGSLNSYEYFSEDYKRKSKKLSKGDREVIDSLITEVKTNCISEDDFVASGEDFVTVIAVISNVKYHCFFDNSAPYDHINESLRKLAHKLVTVSPIRLPHKGA